MVYFKEKGKIIVLDNKGNVLKVVDMENEPFIEEEEIERLEGISLYEETANTCSM